MFKFLVILLLINLIVPSTCRTPSTVKHESNIASNKTYAIPLFGTKSLPFSVNRSRLQEFNVRTILLHAWILDHKVAQFEDGRYQLEKFFYLTNNTEQDNNGSVLIYNLRIHAKVLNVTSLNYHILVTNTTNHVRSINGSVILTVSQPERLIDKIFKFLVPIIIVFVSIQMGLLLDTSALKAIALRPIPVLIGFSCQYGLMPLIAVAISKIFRYSPLHGLSLFIIGCCPGGTGSNQWTVMFDGDLNLSAIMSFASILASFIMMPLWLFTIGQYVYFRELEIHIPFLSLLESLITVIGPFGLGIILSSLFPKLKSITERVSKPIFLSILCFFMVAGGLASFYLLSYVDLTTIITVPFLPWLGFLLGSVVAWICGQDRKRVVTIAIETGIQNISIAYMILLYSLPSPENTQSIVIPFIASFLSTLPFYVVLVYQLIRKKCCKQKRPVRDISIDTLSKTTCHLSDTQSVALNDTSQTEKIFPPMAVVNSSTNPTLP